jgi:hypothetical protein
MGENLKRNGKVGQNSPICDQSNWRTTIQQSKVKFDDSAKGTFLEVLRDTGLVASARKAVGITNNTLREHLINDPEFAELYEDASEQYKDKVLSHAQKLMFEGIQNPIYAGRDGDFKGMKTDYPTNLIAMEMKMVEPRYKERQEIDIRGGGGVLIAPAGLSAEDWIKEQEQKNKERDKT